MANIINIKDLDKCLGEMLDRLLYSEARSQRLMEDTSVCDNCGNVETASGCINMKCLVCGNGVQRLK